MIKITLSNSLVFDAFRDKSGEYNTPGEGLKAFADALAAHGYHMDKYVWGGSTCSQIAPYIFAIDDENNTRIGQAHIAWCRLHGNFSVIGTLMR